MQHHLHCRKSHALVSSRDLVDTSSTLQGLTLKKETRLHMRQLVFNSGYSARHSHCNPAPWIASRATLEVRS